MDSVDIARLVGVARSTVSKAINGYPYIAAGTRERILEAVRAYGYYPNYSAQVLAGKRTTTLGLFFFRAGHFSDDVLADFMISSVIENAAAFGYHTLAYVVRSPEDDATASSLKAAFYQRRVAAGIFIGARNREPLIDQLVADGYAVGVFDQRPASRPEPNRVVTNYDDAGTSRAVIAYLASLGHREIGIIDGDRARYAGMMKHRGFMAGMRANGLPVNENWIRGGDFQSESGYRAMRELLAANKLLPTAVAAANDNTAFGAMRAMEEFGLRIPEDISIVGVDGHPFCQYARPPLTTFEYDIQAMIRGLVSAVIGVVSGKSDPQALRQVYSARL
ncbi:MAG: LacI family DNA-binding transcriptional regulator, partial [Spirochaetes bacterium]|nr:LacI family DNA-binding transcriptional regulator [Spirochaetota bacterium]